MSELSTRIRQFLKPLIKHKVDLAFQHKTTHYFLNTVESYLEFEDLNTNELGEIAGKLQDFIKNFSKNDIEERRAFTLLLRIANKAQ